MNTTQTILAALVATGIASSATYLAMTEETAPPEGAAQPVAVISTPPSAEESTTAEAAEAASDEPEVKRTRTNRAKIHTRNTLLGAAILNEALTDGTGQNDRRKVILGGAIANEALRKDREPVPEDQ